MSERLSGFPDNVLAIVGRGRVMRAARQRCFTPAVENALATHERVRLCYELGPTSPASMPAQCGGFQIWCGTLDAMGPRPSSSTWSGSNRRCGFLSFLMPGGMKSFPTSEAKEACAWKTASLEPRETR